MTMSIVLVGLHGAPPTATTAHRATIHLSHSGANMIYLMRSKSRPPDGVSESRMREFPDTCRRWRRATASRFFRGAGGRAL